MRPHRWSAKRAASAAAERARPARRARRARARRSASTRPSCPARSRPMAARIVPEPAPRARDRRLEARPDRDRRAWPRCRRPGTRNRPRRPSSRAAYRPDRRAAPSRVRDLRLGLAPGRLGGGRGETAAAPGGTPRGSCTSGRCARPPSSRSRPPRRRSSRGPRDRPSSSAPRAGCGRARGRGSPRPRDARSPCPRAGSPRAGPPATGPRRGPRGHRARSRRAGARRPRRRPRSSSRRAAAGRPGSSSRSRARVTMRVPSHGKDPMSSRRIHRSIGVRLMSAKSGSRWKFRRQRTTWSRSACHSPALDGHPVLVLEEPGPLRGLAGTRRRASPSTPARIWRTVSSISDASDRRVAVAQRQQRALDRLVDDAPRPHVPGAELLEHVEARARPGRRRRPSRPRSRSSGR